MMEDDLKGFKPCFKVVGCGSYDIFDEQERIFMLKVDTQNFPTLEVGSSYYKLGGTEDQD